MGLLFIWKLLSYHLPVTRRARCNQRSPSKRRLLNFCGRKFLCDTGVVPLLFSCGNKNCLCNDVYDWEWTQQIPWQSSPDLPSDAAEDSVGTASNYPVVKLVVCLWSTATLGYNWHEQRRHYNLLAAPIVSYIEKEEHMSRHRTINTGWRISWPDLGSQLCGCLQRSAENVAQKCQDLCSYSPPLAINWRANFRP